MVKCIAVECEGQWLASGTIMSYVSLSPFTHPLIIYLSINSCIHPFAYASIHNISL